MNLTLRLYPTDYMGLCHFMFKYAEAQNAVLLADRNMTELVLADFFQRFAFKHMTGEKMRWESRSTLKKHNYQLSVPVAVALFEVMPGMIERLVERQFLATLTQALVNSNHIRLTTDLTPKPVLLLP